MATKKEDIPVEEPRAEPTFLKEVAVMATLAEEAIRKLRTESHGDDFTFKKLDLSLLFPQTVDSLDYLGRLEGVVSDYLSQTARFGLSESASFRSGTPIEENTAGYVSTVTKWMKQVYTSRKEEIDARVDALSKDISDYANLRARDAAFALSIQSDDKNRFIAVAGKPNLDLDSLLAGTLAELKTKFYETELPRPEDLAKLYETCFNAEVKQRGWLELEDAQLIEVLERENALELFQKYNPEREIKLPEENKPKTGIIRRILDIIALPAQAAGAGGRDSSLTGAIILDDTPEDGGGKKTQVQWLAYWSQINDGRIMASMGDFYLYFKSLKDRFEKGSLEDRAAVQTALTSIRNDFDWSGRNNWLIAGTRLFYNANDERSRIVHHYQCNKPELVKEVNLNIPVYLGVPIVQVSAAESGLKYLQAVLDTLDSAEIILPTLEFISERNRRDIKVWTPPINSSAYAMRSNHPERAAGFDYDHGGFHLNGDDSIGIAGCSRGVRSVVPR